MGEIVGRIAPNHLSELSLEELFVKAERFGNVSVFSSRDNAPPRCYRVKIEFDSIPGTQVQAGSDFGMTIQDALIQAIDRSERIVEAYSPGA